MPNVIFARPRHEYDSYRDLYRLIDLSGYPLIYADEIDPDSDNCYIVTLLNGETQGGWPGARAEIILWDLEWRVDDPPRVPGVSRVWASDMWYAAQIGAQYVPLRSHADLISLNRKSTLNYDLAAMMYTGPYRRNNMISRLENAGVRVAGPAWGAERNYILNTSRVMLHIHQHDNIATIAPLRWTLAAAAVLPVIAEVPAIAPSLPGTAWATYKELFCAVRLLLKTPEVLSEMAAELHYLYCVDANFADSVEEAL